MSTTLNGTISPILSFVRQSTGDATLGTISSASQLQIGSKGIVLASGTGSSQADSFWVSTLTLAASTPQTLNLQSLPAGDIAGCASSFAKVRAVYIANLASTTGHTVSVGNATTFPFAPYYSSATEVEAVPAGATMLKTNPIEATWAVSGSVNSIKLDPGSATTTVTVVFIGTSV